MTTLATMHCESENKKNSDTSWNLGNKQWFGRTLYVQSSTFDG